MKLIGKQAFLKFNNDHPVKHVSKYPSIRNLQPTHGKQKSGYGTITALI
jgi:hypothetical protein